MKWKIASVLVLPLLAGLVVYGCGDTEKTATAPTEEWKPWYDHATTTEPTTVLSVTRDRSLKNDIVLEGKVTPAGASFKIKQAGLKVDIGEGAVDKMTKITITAHAGKYVVYSFEPHGLVFNEGAEVKIEQDLKGTSAYVKDNEVLLEGAYLDDGILDLNQADGTAVASELYPVEVDVSKSKAKYNIHHFSGYLLASGRK